ncbi:peptidylprolyl isomerase [Paenibacillus sp. PL2-23]|uniref:peptidylprolyl isomerase n=1 Tax=Paenibacillus sp. PL2-23 TaxID=2100729 RepID=UPI0030FA050F
MKSNEILKTVVIVQAVCMIALAGFVMVKLWPVPGAAGPARDVDKPAGPGIENQEEGVVAQVAGRSITKERLTEELIRQYGDAALRQLMVRHAIDAEAESAGLSVGQGDIDRELQRSAEGYESVEQFYTFMKEQLGMSKEQVWEEIRYRLLLERIAMRDIPVSDEEIDQYIAEHPERYGEKRRYHLRWIVTTTWVQANGIMSRLENGEVFAELASQYSIDEFTSQNGGDLGLIDADDPFYDAAVLEAAANMELAEIAGPIELEQGYAILELAGMEATSAPTGERLYELARRDLVLELAKPQQELEEELLAKHDAVIMK